MRTLALALILVLSLSISVPVRAAVDETNAHRLNALGLFLGTGSGYDLGGSATRLHGIIMLTRMLGEEDAALSFDGPCPFSKTADRRTVFRYDKKRWHDALDNFTVEPGKE